MRFWQQKKAVIIPKACCSITCMSNRNRVLLAPPSGWRLNF